MLIWTIDDYLSRTTKIVGAVILIDDDGILNIVHHDVLKQNVLDEAITGPCP